MHLADSPLVYVLVQVRFSAVESIQKYVPEVQDQLRKKGFPRFIEGKIQDVRLSPLEPPEVKTVPRFEFQNKSGTAGIVLTKGFMSYHVSRYTTFEDFSSELLTAIEVVHGIVGLGLIERVGLRFVDLIRLKEGEKLSDYVDQGLLGLNPEKFQANSPIVTFRMLTRTPAGVLAIRFTQRDDGVFLPPDLQPSTLDHGPMDVQPGELVSFLDFDHFIQFDKTGPDFTPDGIVDMLWKLHDTTDLAFRAATTANAMRAWRANVSV